MTLDLGLAPLRAVSQPGAQQGACPQGARSWVSLGAQGRTCVRPVEEGPRVVTRGPVPPVPRP